MSDRFIVTAVEHPQDAGKPLSCSENCIEQCAPIAHRPAHELPDPREARLSPLSK